MLPELSILKHCLSHENFLKTDGLLSIESLQRELQGPMRALAAFHKANPGHTLSVDDLANLLPPSKDKEFVYAMLDNLRTIEVHHESVGALLRQVRTAHFLRQISMAAYEASEGSEKAFETFQKTLSALESSKDKGSENEQEFEFTSTNLEELLDSAVFSKGLSWRLASLNKTLGPLRKGDFGFIFARPETGKTTFLADAETWFAEQLDNDDGPVLHLNNEEQNEKVMLRMHQASAGCTLEQLYSNKAKYQKLFDEATKGKLLMPKLGSSIHFKQIERLCERYSPSLVVIDQIDKVLGLDNDREDLRLGAIYQRTRELAKDFCPFIGVCQADGSGEGQKWLSMANVANAKTSKQAEADWILGIGKIPDAGYDKMRFFNISKNKLLGSKETDANRRHDKWEVLIDPMHARYVDLTTQG